MERYTKFIDTENIQYAPRVIMEGDTYIANPNPQLLQEHGYKPLVSDTQPATGDNEHLEPRYEDTQVAVLRHWDIVQDEETQEGGEDE